MRTLIVGGGVAGLALAAKLARQDREPVVLERASEYGESGYGISLYPFGSAVLHGIGAYEGLAESSVEMRTYEIGGGDGEVIRSLDMAGLTAEYGPSLMTSHTALIELLREAGGDRVDLRMGSGVRAIRASGEEIEAELRDGSVERFDLLVGCDGIHSGVRDLLFGAQPGFDTGWVAWTWWGREGIFPPETVRELWLSGALFGVYPAPGRAMYLVAVPSETADPDARPGDADVVERLRGALGPAAELPQVRGALAEASELWPWRLRDVRSEKLRDGRVVLCGDSGTAFLPTAGVGASAALRSAAALADELSRADARLVPLALDRYLERTTKPIRANQRDSRRLARAMFVRSRLLSRGRDLLTRRMPVGSMVGSILAAMREHY